MPSKRPHARQAAAQRARRARLRRRALAIGLPLGVILLAAVVAVAVTGPDEGAPPEPGSAEELALGAEVFARHCATCHGASLEGGLAGPPLVHDIYRPDHHPDIAFRNAIAQGVEPHHWNFAAMPPIHGLSDHEVEAVIAHVRAVQAEEWGEE
jgi:mono/diheme cytochrome c family protein